MPANDALTDLPSHTAFQLHVREALDKVSGEDASVSVAILDIDNFRIFNEAQSHLKGDEFLLWMANFLKVQLKDGEFAARVGGDEFALILVGQKLTEVVRRLEKLRTQVDTDSRPVTLSVGIASYPRDARNIQGLLKAVDDALYVAKRGGRNQVSVSKTFEERHCKPLKDDGDSEPGSSAS